VTVTIAFTLGGLLAIVLQSFEEQGQGDRFSQTHPLHPLPLRDRLVNGRKRGDRVLLILGQWVGS
jgi:hypothetical protein